MKRERHTGSLAGAVMGGGAILLWSTPATVYFVVVGKQLGLWQFLAGVALAGGLLQIVGYLALGRRLRLILAPPPKMWPAILLGFVAYLSLYNSGLVMARSATQVMGVNLMNYLWPALTVLFTTWLVPGERMRARLVLAMVLSLAGVLLAVGVDTLRPVAAVTPWPYVLGGLAAVSWAIFCALISRWRDWAKDYAASPLGFILAGLLAAGICLWRGEWQPMTAPVWTGLLVTALGPWAGGYMLWEMALHRVSGVTLGLMGAATPVLSTLALIGLFVVTRSGQVDAVRVAVLLAAAVLIAVSVALGRKRPVDETPDISLIS